MTSLEEAKEFVALVEKGVALLGVSPTHSDELDAIDKISQNMTVMLMMTRVSLGEMAVEEIQDEVKKFGHVLFEAHPKLYVYIRYLIAYCVGYGAIKSG